MRFCKLWKENNLNQAATRAKSEFLANMSHEIRTPLNAILGMGELLEAVKLNTEEQKYLKILQNAGQNLMTLINDILDLSKIEAGHMELEKNIFCLQTLIKETVLFLAPGAHEKGLEFYCQINSELSYCEGDSPRIRQILVNLLSNAVKFTKKGSITVSAEVPVRRKFLLIFMVMSYTRRRF